MIILDGKKLSQKILDNLEKKQLKLAVILVGDNSVSQKYIDKKKQACQYVGIDFELFKFPLDIEEEEFRREVKNIADDSANSGIVIQLPLPKDFNTQEILNIVSLEKDIDALAEGTSFVSPIVRGIDRFFEEYNISLEDKNILIIGKGRLVGQPIASWLEKKGIEFSIIDKSVQDISLHTLKADIIISGVGKPNLIKGDMVKQGAVIIDAGTSSDGAKGDVEFETASQKAGYITPVPNGVGPMTVAFLLDNLINGPVSI